MLDVILWVALYLLMACALAVVLGKFIRYGRESGVVEIVGPTSKPPQVQPIPSEEELMELAWPVYTADDVLQELSPDIRTALVEQPPVSYADNHPA